MIGMDGTIITQQQKLLFYILKQDGSPVGVMELADELDLPQSTVSRDLTQLAADGFLYREKQGKKVLYYPEEEIFEELCEAYQEFKEAYETALDMVDLPEDESATNAQAEGENAE